MTKLYRERQYKGKIFPTGEFSFGYDAANYAVERQKSKNYERIHAMQYHDLVDEDSNAWMRLPLDVAQAYCPAEVVGQEERLTLGLSTLRNSHNRPKRYGLKGITSYGKKMVKSCAYLLEEKYGKDRLTFATYTLPAMGEVFRWYLHENWGVFVNRLMQEIQRELRRKNASSEDYVAVTEVQERRLKSFGKVYLHLHVVWVGRRLGGGHCISTKRSDRILAMVLQRLARQCEKEMGKRVEPWEYRTTSAGKLERVAKSVVDYLGKYLSKGNRTARGVPDGERSQFYPRQWWTASKTLKKEVKARIHHLNHGLCKQMAESSSFRQEWVKWIVPITKEFQGTVYTLGYTGRLKKGWECLLDSSESESPPVPPSKTKCTLDSPATIRIRRRRVPLYLPSSRSPSSRVVKSR